MKKFLKIVLILFCIPVVILLGTFAFLKFADLNSYKPKIEELTQKYANLQIKINGDVDVGVSLKPSIKLSDVEIIDPKKQQKVAHIGNALVEFSILPLLRKEIVVNTLQTDNTEIFYSQNDSLLINDLDASMDDYASPIKVLFDTTVANIDIYGDVQLSSFKEITSSKYNNLALDANVNALGYKLSFNGNLNDLQSQIKALGDYVISRKNTKINGNLDFQMTETVPFIKLSTASDEINVADFLDTKTASNNWLIKSANAEEYIPNTTVPYEYLRMVNADITLDVKTIKIQPNMIINNVKGNATLQDGVFKADIANVRFDNNDISGHVELTSPKSLPYIKLNIKGDGFDLTKWQKKTLKKADGFDWLISSAHASALMPNTVIPYNYLKMANGDISVNLKNLKLSPETSLSAIKAAAALKSGVLNTDIQNITAGGGVIKGNIVLNSAQKSATVKLTGNNILLQKLYTPYANANNPQLYVKNGGNMTFNLNLNTSGADTNQYLSNVSGAVIVYMDKSVLLIKSLEKLKGNIFAQILNSVNFNVGSKDMNLSCAVVRSDISGGVMHFPKGIAIDAKDFYLVADGKINLGNDKINLDLQPFSGKISDVNISNILGNLIKITGTLNHPTIGINQTATAKNVIGAIASGGAYNVGDLMLSADKAPCHTALKGTAYADHFPADTSASSGVSKGYNSTKDAISDVGKGIKNQAKDIKKQFKGLFK